jgi:hypothetical protein
VEEVSARIASMGVEILETSCRGGELRWRWTDDPADPGRWQLHHPDVQRLAAVIAPGAHLTDLGGAMSLNVRLDPLGLVLRVHQAHVSRARLLVPSVAIGGDGGDSIAPLF